MTKSKIAKKPSKPKKKAKPKIVKEIEKPKRSKKWLYWFVPVMLIIVTIAVIAIVPSWRQAIIDKITTLIYGPPPQEQAYNSDKDKAAIQGNILDFYHAYQEFDAKKIVALTDEPLTTYEKKHCETLKKQDENYNQPKLEVKNLTFEYKTFNATDAEISVKRNNVLDVSMPFKFGETAQGEMQFKLKKDGEDWKIINRTYNTIWVSEVY